MSYSFTRPLSRGWQEMSKQLFQPFDIGRWLSLGFTAWLALLTDSCGSSGSSFSPPGGGGTSEGPSAQATWPETGELVETGRQWLATAKDFFVEYWWAFVAVAFGILLLFAFWLLLLWVSSRGKLMFVDNVVFRRAEVVAPWKQQRELGDSLFGFRLLFGLATAGVGILLLGGLGYILYTASSTGDWSSPLVWGLGALLGLVTLGLSLFTAYLLFFLDAFVVPIMHRKNLRTMAAWGEFSAIFRANPLPFLLVGLLTFLAFLAVGVAIFVFGIATCCVGFLFLLIPYVSTVLLLPLHVTYRAFTVEFLAQFDPEIGLTPDSVPPPPPPGDEMAALA